MTIKLGYARVSTNKQSTDNQMDALLAAGCAPENIYEDQSVSGETNGSSPRYLALFERVRELREQGEDVAVVVTKIDRLSRDTITMIGSVLDLGRMGASFEPLDGFLAYRPNDPGSEFMLTIYAGVVQLDRAQIIARMKEGRDYKVGKGLRLGQKPKLTLAAVNAIRSSYETTKPKPSPQTLAAQWDVSRPTIIRVLGLPGAKAPYVSLDEWQAAKEAANV
ncbi:MULTISPECIES: recombinase family protein [Curtobacterium]|uniref:recombinase family protein n=1 Tax=Curtobacterium flaccumfaciens TaxID=2035 RepID=UPI003EE49558